MPLYDYCCETCNIIDEYLMSANDSAPECISCSNTMKKLLSVPQNYTGVCTKYVNRKLDALGPEGSKYKD